MYNFPFEITEEILIKNNLKSVTLIGDLNESSTPPRLIIDRGVDTEKNIDGEEEINNFLNKLKL
jgi:hypothetical protein